MIIVLPSSDDQKKSDLKTLTYKHNEEGKDFTLFTVKINNTIVGYASVDVFDIYTRLHYIEILSDDNKNLILDYIVRTIMSYSLNRNIFTIMCSNKEYFNELSKFYFYEKNSVMYLEIYKHMGCSSK